MMYVIADLVYALLGTWVIFEMRKKHWFAKWQRWESVVEGVTYPLIVAGGLLVVIYAAIPGFNWLLNTLTVLPPGHFRSILEGISHYLGLDPLAKVLLMGMLVNTPVLLPLFAYPVAIILDCMRSEPYWLSKQIRADLLERRKADGPR